MIETEHRDENETPRYTTPRISDYGDLVELTAGGATGSRNDVVLPTTGLNVTFLSSAG